MTCDWVWIFSCACLTQAVAHYRNSPIEVRVPLPKEGVEHVDLWGHRVHYGLAVGGTVIEKQVQQSVVGEMSQPADAG